MTVNPIHYRNPDARPPESPGAVMAKGAFWASGMRWSVKVIGLLSTIILARLLAPEDFGIVTKAVIILGMTEMLSESGFSQPLIRMNEPTEAHYKTVFTLNLALSSVTALVTAGAAYPASILLNQPELAYILPILAIRVFILGAINPRITDFRRTFNFRKDFIFQIVSKSFLAPVTIFLAFYFRDYRALIGGQVSSAFITVILSYIFIRFKPGFTFKHRKEFIGFTAAYIAAEYAEFLIKRIDVIILSFLLPAAALGLYNFSAEIAALLTAELIAPASRAFYPVFSSVRDKPDALKKYYLQSVAFTFPVSVAIGCGLFIVAEPLLVTIAGEKWREGAPVFALLGAGGAASVFSALNLTVLNANGQVRKRAKLSAINFIALFCVLTPLAYVTRCVYATAEARAAIAFVFLAANMIVVSRALSLPFKALLQNAYRAIIAGAVMTAFCFSLRPLPFSDPLSLFILVTSGAFIFTGALFGLWAAFGKPEGAESLLLAAIRAKFFKKVM